MMKDMTREDYMDLFDLKEGDEGMINADECQDQTGLSWYEIAKASISQMNWMLQN